jgi:Putative beta-lactamase-inhibitor-like, PepSY-like
MTINLKNFIGVFAFAAVLFTVACTKETLDNILNDANIVAVDELVTFSDPSNGTKSKLMDEPAGGPTSPDSVGHGGGHGGGHGHGWGRGRGSHPGRIAGDSIGFSGLPSAAQTYLLTNSDTSKIVRIVKITLPDGTFQYVVRLNNRTHLHFDAAGVVIVTTTDRHQFTNIAITDLPAAAQTYLNANTTAANIVGIIKVTKLDGTVIYGVRLADNKRFTFDAAGALIANPTGGRRGRH